MDSPNVLFSYFPDLTGKQKHQFENLGALYTEWNRKINVISRKDVDHLYLRHVLHSLGIARVLSFRPGTSVLDVGTGGGFPGIPLAILSPTVRFHLIDSIQKKITVVNDVASRLGLENVTSEAIRAEKLRAKYDFVVSRAVTGIKSFHEQTRHLFLRENRNRLENGILCLKGGDLEKELRELKMDHNVIGLRDSFKEEYFQEKKVVHVPVVTSTP